MHAWESIQNVLDYIEDNLAESHSPEELAVWFWRYHGKQ